MKNMLQEDIILHWNQPQMNLLTFLQNHIILIQIHAISALV